MELLKVFVGDGTTSIKTIAGLSQGDMLLVKASDNSVLTQATAAALSNSEQVKVVGKNSKGLVFSTPFSRNDVVKVNYVAGTGVTPKVMHATMGFDTTLANNLSKTFTLGVQIKEDLRMGTYNKNTEILASHVTPSTPYPSVAVMLNDMTSNLAKGFAANPLTSAGSPSQLVKVERYSAATKTSLATNTATFKFTKGAREVYINANLASTLTAGKLLSVGTGVGAGSGGYDVVYQIEKSGVWDGTNTIFSLDTAYQGETITTLAATGTTVGTTVGTLSETSTAVTTIVFKFTGVAQSRSNRFDQYRVIDFVVVSPKGFDVSSADLTISVPTALVYGQGTWSQVRDMEEKSFTNISPLVNYREFPFSDYNLNADAIATTTNFNLFTLVHNAPAGYNYMQSSGKTFPQVTVCALPTSSQDGTPLDNDHFSSVLVGWWVADADSGAADFGGNENFDLGPA